MARLPISIGATALAATLVGASAFVADPHSFDQVAALVVFIGLGVVGLTGFVGLVLARAPWGRWTLLVSMSFGLVLASLSGGWIFWVALALGSISTVGLAGPWLTLWLRQSAVVDAPGPVVIILMSAAAGAILWVGLSAGSGFQIVHIALIATVIASSRGYGRGQSWGIWGLRLAVPIVGAASVYTTAGFGQVLLAIGLLGITILAWLPHAKRATAVITPPLPAPVERSRKDQSDAVE
ncbi:MAG: hypothetical protein ACC654_08060 [Acidimicrobiia bacterium]